MTNVCPWSINERWLPLRVTLAAPATDAAIQKNIYGLAMTALIISNEEMKGIMKIVKSFEESRLLINSVIKKIENKVKKQKGEFLSMLMANLGARLLGNMLACKGVIWAGEWTITAGQDF